MKKYFLFVFIALTLTSCKKCRECFGPCSTILVDAFFLNDGFDATGKNFNNPFVLYLYDSIRYQVITSHDTTEHLVPEIIESGINRFRFRYNLSNNPNSVNTEEYYFIIFLNEIERDTVKVFYKKGETEYFTYQGDSLAVQTSCDGIPYPLRILK